MSNDVVVPGPDIKLGECPHCGAQIRVDTAWYKFFLRIRDILNGLP